MDAKAHHVLAAVRALAAEVSRLAERLEEHERHAARRHQFVCEQLAEQRAEQRAELRERPIDGAASAPRAGALSRGATASCS